MKLRLTGTLCLVQNLTTDKYHSELEPRPLVTSSLVLLRKQRKKKKKSHLEVKVGDLARSLLSTWSFWGPHFLIICFSL
jgi:hypothetical protein